MRRVRGKEESQQPRGGSDRKHTKQTKEEEAKEGEKKKTDQSDMFADALETYWG